MAEDDWDGWKLLDRQARRQVPACRRRSVRHQHRALREGIENGVANAILIKVNQIGTLTETLDAIEMAHTRRLHGGDVASLRRNRRSTIADLAVATNCGQIKTGSLSRTDRSRNTTNCCASRRSSGAKRAMRAAAP